MLLIEAEQRQNRGRKETEKGQNRGRTEAQQRQNRCSASVLPLCFSFARLSADSLMNYTTCCFGSRSPYETSNPKSQQAAKLRPPTRGEKTPTGTSGARCHRPRSGFPRQTPYTYSYVCVYIHISLSLSLYIYIYIDR